MNFEQRVNQLRINMVIDRTYVIADSSYDAVTKKSFWSGAIIDPKGTELLGGTMDCDTSNIAEVMAAWAAVKHYNVSYGHNRFTLVTDSDAVVKVKGFRSLEIVKINKHGKIGEGLELLTKLFKVIDREAYKALRTYFGRKMRSK
jgi:ribonuclease HI